MKESLVLFWILVMLATVSPKQTKLVVDLMKHGATAPRYTANPIYSVTKSTYKEDPGELTDEGTIQMERHGKDLAQEFIVQNKFLPDTFQPENFYQKTYSDEPSVMSAYATMLGAYPDSVSWIQYSSIDSDSNAAPFAREEELEVRRALRLSTEPNRLTTREMTIWSEEEGQTFFNDPTSNCPQLQRDFDSHLDQANNKYSTNQKFDGLYEDMSETFGIPEDKLNFKTAHIYLDDYTTAKANNKPVPKFLDDGATNQQIKNYYHAYEYEGKFGGDTADARIVSNNFLNYVMTTMYGKVQVDKGNIDNDHYNHIKYSQFVGNENAMVAATKMLGITVDGDPDFASKLRFELYESQGEHYVKSTYDGKPFNLGGSSDGIMKYDDFMKNLYDRLYFGNLNSYCRGQEDISSNTFPTKSTYDEYLKSRNIEFRSAATAKAKPIQESSTVQASSVTAKSESTLRSAKSDQSGYVQQGFFELAQVETRPEPRVVEVVEPIYVERPRAAMAERRVVQPRVESMTVERPALATRQAAAYHQPAARASSYYSAGAAHESAKQADVIDIDVKKVAGWNIKPKNPCIKNEKYDPRNTHECTVDIPYLHSLELPQVIHDRQVVVVPQQVPVETVRVEEKLVTEKPTEIHHFKLEKEAIGAPTQFHEKVTDKSGWPWWWWIPLLL